MVQNSVNKGVKLTQQTGESSSSGSQESQRDHELDALIKSFAKCKWFNASKGYGFVSLEDPSEVTQSGDSDDKPIPDVFVYQKSIHMPGFRSLQEGERVEVWYKKSHIGFEAVKVAGPEGGYCKGSEKRPKKRKKAADRCYNCDERGHHAKECKLPPMPKRCHHCKSVDHLVADCTMKREKPSVSSQSENNPSSSPEHQRTDDARIDPSQEGRETS